MSSQTDLHYELPPTPERIRAGWISTFQSAAVISGLVAAVASQLCGYYQDPSAQGASYHAVITLNYASLIGSIGATFTSLILIDEFSEMPSRGSRHPSHREKNQFFDGTDWTVLTYYHLNPKIRWVIWHWFFSLAVSYLCLFAALVTYIWREAGPLTTRIVLAALTGLICAPLVWFLPIMKDGFVRLDSDGPYVPRHFNKRKEHVGTAWPPRRSLYFTYFRRASSALYCNYHAKPKPASPQAPLPAAELVPSALGQEYGFSTPLGYFRRSSDYLQPNKNLIQSASESDLHQTQPVLPYPP